MEIGHVRRGKRLPVEGKKTKKNLFYSGCLGFDHSSVLDRFDPFFNQKRRKTADLAQELLIGSILEE